MTIVLLGATANHALASPYNSCQIAFLKLLRLQPQTELQAFEAKLFADTVARTSAVPPTIAPTVYKHAKVTGQFGGTRYLAKLLEDSPWESGFGKLRIPRSSVYYDAQGDLRWPIMAMGYDLARVAGLEVVDRNTLLVSDLAEMQGRVSAFNSYLVSKGIEPIPAKLVEDSSSRFLRDRLLSYLNGFKDQLAHPIASAETEWSHFLHDLSYHAFMISLPVEALQYLQVRTSYELAVYQEVEAKAGSSQFEQLHKSELLLEIADKLDLNFASFQRTTLAVPTFGLKHPNSSRVSVGKTLFTIKRMKDGTVRSPKVLIHTFGIGNSLARGYPGNTSVRDISTPRISLINGLNETYSGTIWMDPVNRAVEAIKATDIGQIGETPLFRSDKDLEALARKIEIRKVVLQRAARDFWHLHADKVSVTKP